MECEHTDWDNIAFLRNTFGIDIINNEITPCNNLPTVHLTIEQYNNLKMLIAVRNGDATSSFLSSYDIECLITNLATV